MSQTRSPVEPADFIFSTVEDFVREVKVAMQEAISTTGFCQAPSSSENKNTMRSPMGKEMFSILSESATHAQPKDGHLTVTSTQAGRT